MRKRRFTETQFLAQRQLSFLSGQGESAKIESA